MKCKIEVSKYLTLFNSDCFWFRIVVLGFSLQLVLEMSSLD
jgi:hypothetical protein